jgi:hypothetical protein
MTSAIATDRIQGHQVCSMHLVENELARGKSYGRVSDQAVVEGAFAAAKGEVPCAGSPGGSR